MSETGWSVEAPTKVRKNKNDRWYRTNAKKHTRYTLSYIPKLWFEVEGVCIDYSHMSSYRDKIKRYERGDRTWRALEYDIIRSLKTGHEQYVVEGKELRRFWIDRLRRDNRLYNQHPELNEIIRALRNAEIGRREFRNVYEPYPRYWKDLLENGVLYMDNPICEKYNVK